MFTDIYFILFIYLSYYLFLMLPVMVHPPIHPCLFAPRNKSQGRAQVGEIKIVITLDVILPETEV